jgi:hypothetical protein
VNIRPIRVFSQDESRFDLLTIRRRRLTARGVQPVGRVQHVFEWFYVYGAVEPISREHFFLELPYLNAESFQIFIGAFAVAFPDSLNLLLLDTSGVHTAQRLTLPANVRRRSGRAHRTSGRGPIPPHTSPRKLSRPVPPWQESASRSRCSLPTSKTRQS